MTVRQSVKHLLVVSAIIGMCTMSAGAADIVGRNIPTNYAGFLAGSQTNATGYGNGYTTTQNNVITIGSELDALYVSADAANLWIGITGNLPNLLAEGQAIIILLDADGGTPASPNVLDASLISAYGGGANAIRNLTGTILEPGFAPETAIVVNRVTSSSPNCTTYVDSFYLPTGFQDLWDANLMSLDPNNALYLSAWMDTTNILGVTDDATKDGAEQQALAATAVKGLRLRLDRSYFAIGGEIKIMVLLGIAGADDLGNPVTFVSNQVLPPLSTADDPNDCLTPPWPVNFDETYGTPPGYQGTQLATLTPVAGTPTAFDGANIPAQFPAGSLVATQQLHTCFGNAVMGSLTYTVPGSELDQLFIRADDTFLQVAVSGNLEANGNKVYFFVDADPNAGENVLDTTGLQPDNAMWNWSGRTFDPGFAPEHCYVVNNWQGTLYCDHYALLTDTKTYLGSTPVGGNNGILQGGTNTNNDEIVLDNSNQLGVAGYPAAAGDPSTATTGFEMRLSLAELGLTPAACKHVKVFVALTNQDAAWVSNQFLPPIESPSDNIGTDRPPATAFNFGSTTAPFNGNQFSDSVLYMPGDVNEDCCINLNDITAFVQTLLGNPPSASANYLADINKDGLADGADIEPFITLLISQSPCP
jgi:hypothetical protein